ncbi:MAG: hypothetical protein KAX58_10310 [Aeromonadaceae bacterium]|uniref:DUF3718 domain-containing protein n=2 Tax=Aeromonas media TaxID=651 RepID=A0AAE7AEP6_AERME|nr:hypothetical protein [Aeromonas media]MBP6451386.1 hypothetical protein [Aeromonas sp.]MBP8221819.1 hypothetical protein [Aeromonadaceae bacterium]QJT29885.1 hypothetical protein E4186_06500 [Aeromonas media]QJT35503.1 hypothetical protein E4187_14940 [Aeromonas media]QJT37322.1 hypothetical protein E4188_01060 [Aeromonas media]
MAQILRLVASLLLLHICAEQVVAASMTETIEESLAAQDYRLIVRGGMAPGVVESLQAEARTRCGVRYLEGFGDVIEIGKEAEFKQRIGYATRYNRRMLEKCMPEAIER